MLRQKFYYIFFNNLYVITVVFTISLVEVGLINRSILNLQYCVVFMHLRISLMTRAIRSLIRFERRATRYVRAWFEMRRGSVQA